jgi:hypothetical protein
VPPRPAAFLAALALAAAGCGGGGDEDGYADDFKPVNARIVALGGEVGDSVSGARQKSNEELSREFAGFADELGRIRRDLDALDPPDDLRHMQETLLAAMDRVQGDLEDIGDAAGSGDARAAGSASRDLVVHSLSLRDSRRALARESGAAR